MSSAIESTILASVEGSTLPYDFYREVHKGLRLALFTLTTELGAAAFADPHVRAHSAARVAETVAVLHAHHAHEDTFISPLLEQHAPRLRAIVDAGHAETEADLAEIDRLTAFLGDTAGGDAVVVGLALYRYLALFAARYLAHMALEEGEVMATLREAMTVGELFAVDMELRASIAPDAMCRFIAVMVPAMNPDERFAMLAGMSAGAPAEIFELFRDAAMRALTPADGIVLAARLAAI